VFVLATVEMEFHGRTIASGEPREQSLESLAILGLKQAFDGMTFSAGWILAERSHADLLVADLAPIENVYWKSHRPPLPLEGMLKTPADPVGRISAESRLMVDGIEQLGRSQKTQPAFLDEVVVVEAVIPGAQSSHYVRDQAQVRLDQLVARGLIASLNPGREFALLSLRQGLASVGCAPALPAICRRYWEMHGVKPFVIAAWPSYR
jgi:hypothetical protein